MVHLTVFIWMRQDIGVGGWDTVGRCRSVPPLGDQGVAVVILVIVDGLYVRVDTEASHDAGAEHTTNAHDHQEGDKDGR